MNRNENGKGMTPDVYCDVKNCTYHDGRLQMHSQAVSTWVPTYAVSTNDTACSTFKPQAR